MTEDLQPVSGSRQTSLDLRAKQARARALASAIWLVGAAACSALLLAGHDTSPAGMAMAVLGGALVVGIVIALTLIAVNASLNRDPDRIDARGAADLLCFAIALVAVLTVVLILAFGAPAAGGGVVVAPVLLALLLFAMLLVIGLWTRASAQRRNAVAQP